MARIVVKFGGSNLKTRNDINKVIQAVNYYDSNIIIVVSAFYGITNSLIDLVNNARSQNYSSDKFISELYKEKVQVIDENIESDIIRTETLLELDRRIFELRSLFEGVRCIGDVPKSIEDLILSYGERLSSLILTAILKDKGKDVREALPENIGLITDGEYGNASVDFEIASTSVRINLPEGRIYVVPGFYGISTKLKVTLLGRGGSDYSAAAIAACVKAESLDIWKDVDGFMSTDPKIVANAQVVPFISYTEASELSYFGARILHPRTVEPLAFDSIPVRFFNIDKVNEGLKFSTVVKPEPDVKVNIVKSVTYSDDFAILKLKGAGIGIKPGILAKVANALEKENINIKSVITSQISINILLSVSDCKKAAVLIQKLQIHGISEIEKIDDVSLIAVIGEGINEAHGIAARTFGAVAKKGINVEIIAFGASPVASYFIVKQEYRNVALTEIHDEFFTSHVNSKNSVSQSALKNN